MKRRHVLVLSCLVSFLSHAQAPSEREVQQALEEQQRVFVRNSVRADGKTNPGLIPFGVVAEMAFFQFGRQANDADGLRSKLRTTFGGSAADIEALFQIAATSLKFAEDVRNQEGRELDASCSTITRGNSQNTTDAVRTAREFKAIETRRMEAIEAHYRKAIEDLSGPTRSALLRYLDTDVRPRVQWSSVDLVGVATEIPEDWLFNQRLSCERRLALTPNQRAWTVSAPEPIALK